MKVEYISHACLLIDSGDLKIVTDPWFGAAYCDQWYVFPKPVNTDAVKNADVVLISHGHEDHLHEETLKSLLPKTAKVFYPYHFFGGAKEFIQSMGFEQVKEAVTYKRYKLSEKTAVTFIINSHDSLMVIEADGKILVNVNDALHSYPQKVIDFYLNELTTNFPKIDVLFCGFGGASYFPNAMHLEGKDDMEVGLVREQLFAHNFCRVVAALKPQVAVPFAADFALLADDQRWINDCRFPRAKMADYYRRHFQQEDYEPRIYDMYSGDVLEANGEYKLLPLSPYRKLMHDGGRLEHLIDEQYQNEIAALAEHTFITEEKADELVEAVQDNVQNRSALYKPEKLEKVRFCLEVTDVAENNFYHVAFENGKAKLWRAAEAAPDVLLVIRLTSKILEYSIASDWGADVISIGYGAEINITSRKAATVDLESVCMNLLACYPTPLGTLKKAPLRTAEFMISNPAKYTRSIKKLKRHNFNSENYDRKVWLLKKPQEIREIYNLPELDKEFLPENVS